MTVAPDCNDRLCAGTLPLDPREGTAPMPPSKGGNGAQPHAPQGEPPSFIWIPQSEIFAPLPPIPWTCRDLMLCSGRPALWAGYGYSGKTLIIQSYLLAIASGSRLWGQHHVAQGPVVHIDHEQGRRGTLHRYQRLARALGVATGVTAENLHIACLPNVYLTSPGAEDAYCRALDAKVAAAVDSLRAATSGKDENDSAIRQWLDMLTRVGERTACQINVTHHAGKGVADRDGREQPRGSGGIFDACGAVFNVSSPDPTEPKKIVNVKTGAEAPGSALAPFYVEFQDVPSEDGADPHWGLRVTYRTKQQVHPPTNASARWTDRKAAVLECIRDNPGVAGTGAVAVRMGVRLGDVRQAVRELLDDNMIENRGTAQRPRLHPRPDTERNPSRETDD